MQTTSPGSELAIRSEPTDYRQVPRLLVHAVEFESPFYESWPPAAHREIFFHSENQDKPQVYAREVLERFATRAFRRPIHEEEGDTIINAESRVLIDLSGKKTDSG